MRACSNSAIAPKMCICSLPAGVVASMRSPSDTNAMPSACCNSSVSRVSHEWLQRDSRDPADLTVTPINSELVW